MSILKRWPLSLQEYLREYGEPISEEKLSGIKDYGGCYRIRFKHKSLIIKHMKSPQEYLFYTEATKHINISAKHIPNLYWYCKSEEGYWIIIEDITNPLPRERWSADAEVINTLYKLHNELWEKTLPIEEGYLPKWESKQTEALLSLYSFSRIKELEPIIYKAQRQAQQLFKPYCWINADTNPTNWGIRDDRTLVLFDWERITCGSPAIDLAITIPGLGSKDNAVEAFIAKKYLENWSRVNLYPPFEAEELLLHINLAKVWSVVEFLENPPVLSMEYKQSILEQLAEKIIKLQNLKNFN